MIRFIRTCACLAALIFSVNVFTVTGFAQKLEKMSLASGWQLQDAAKVAQPGAEVAAAGFNASGWYNATVPGTVLTSLVNDHVYPEPLYGENNRTNSIPDSLCRASYWYRKQVNVPPAFTGRQVWLNFDGINYIAEVWINGHDLGNIRGAFVRGIFNVTPFVKPGETATVAVLIQPPPHPGIPLEQTVANGTGGNGGILSQDGPTFICTLGCDWIPGIRYRDMGIWQNVTLAASGPVVVENPLVTSHLPLPRTDVADLTVEATVHNVTGAPQTGVLKGAFMFMSDLSRAIALPSEVDFMAVSSYAGTHSEHKVQLIMDLRSDIRGRHVDASIRPNQIFAVSLGCNQIDPFRHPSPM